MICMHCRTELTSEEEPMHTCRGRVEFIREEEKRNRVAQTESDIAEMLAGSKMTPPPLCPNDVLSGPDDL